MSTTNLITLTTDFGLEDPYVGQMKGAILKRNNFARIIDLTHAIAPHDILQGAVVIRTSYRYFPDATIHLVVVDPEVGTQRGILAARADKHIFIAPDNGLLTLLGMDNRIEVIRRVENQSLFPTEISSTFHGRDIMAPVAAALAGGLSLEEVGPEILFADCVQLDIPEPVVEKDVIRGHMLHSDRFGNIRTTITTRHLSAFQPSNFAGITIGDLHIGSISSTYGECSAGEPVAVIDSSGYLEIAINRGNAALELACQPGEEIVVHYQPEGGED
jgi:S-adenosylmethionine hydrolase